MRLWTSLYGTAPQCGGTYNTGQYRNLYIYMSIFEAIYLYVCLFIFLHIYLFLSIFFISISWKQELGIKSIHPSIYNSINKICYLDLSVHPSSMYLFIHPSLYLSAYLSIYLSIYLPICPSIYLSIYLSIYAYLSFYTFIDLHFIYNFIYKISI